MTDYNKLKVTELKELLKERGIPSTGLSRKNQIVEALEANDASNTAGGEGDAVQDGKHEQDVAVGGQDVPAEAHAEDARATENKAEQPQPTPPVEEAPVQDNAVPDHVLSEPQQPITELEKNSPVSKEPSAPNTPMRMSPAAESVSSDTRKRKRRSPTPPISQETVIKKLKSATEELVKLPEDEAVEDAPMPIGNTQDPMAIDEEAKTIQPLSVSDDAMAVSGTPPGEEVVIDRGRGASPTDTTAPEEVLESRPSSPSPLLQETSALPSIHPLTRAIYIRDLVRPLQPQELRNHIIDIATSPPADTSIRTFHLNALRTHAFVVFDTTQAASSARAALHGRIWPDEPSRKDLWVDFVPELKVEDWIEEEVKSGGRRDAKKWEVVYDTEDDGMVIATHQEAISFPPPTDVRRQSSISTRPIAPVLGQGMPNAPLGPRADRPSSSSQRPPPVERAESRSKPARPRSNATFDALDQNFHHTTAKPKLYWLPVSADLVEKRLDEITAQTSRSWDGGRAMRDASTVEKQLRRYTFEDGDKVVDNGADIPSFRSEGGRPPGAGRGGRGGGGYRGRR